jgi:hypothetical protein
LPLLRPQTAGLGSAAPALGAVQAQLWLVRGERKTSSLEMTPMLFHSCVPDGRDLFGVLSDLHAAICSRPRPVWSNSIDRKK